MTLHCHNLFACGDQNLCMGQNQSRPPLRALACPSLHRGGPVSGILSKIHNYI